MNNIEQSYLKGFIKAATASPSMSPTGAPNQIQSNSGGMQQPGGMGAGVPSGQGGNPNQGAQPPQLPGAGLGGMGGATSSPQQSGGMQNFMQLMQQLRQQNPMNQPAPPPVQNQHLMPQS